MSKEIPEQAQRSLLPLFLWVSSTVGYTAWPQSVEILQRRIYYLEFGGERPLAAEIKIPGAKGERRVRYAEPECRPIAPTPQRRLLSPGTAPAPADRGPTPCWWTPLFPRYLHLRVPLSFSWSAPAPPYPTLSGGCFGASHLCLQALPLLRFHSQVSLLWKTKLSPSLTASVGEAS